MQIVEKQSLSRMKTANLLSTHVFLLLLSPVEPAQLKGKIIIQWARKKQKKI
jgi:hypothetical protein